MSDLLEKVQMSERIEKLEESLRDCASKLESQLGRSELPKSYQVSVSKAFSLLNE